MYHTLQNTTVSFVGAMTSADSASTVATLTVPVAGNHSVITKLDSGAILGSQRITVLPSEPHAPSTAVPEAPVVSHLASLFCCVLCMCLCVHSLSHTSFACVQ
jgi:hypothetical protein